MDNNGTWVESLLKRFAILYDKRYLILEDDSYLLPTVKKALIKHKLPCNIGKRLPSIGLEHSIHYLGTSHIIKISLPDKKDIIKKWVKWISKGHGLLKKFISPQHLLNEKVILVPLENNTAIYIIVANLLKGKSLFRMTDDEIYENPVIVKNLVSFFKGNLRLYKKTGLTVDIGSPPSKPFNPRFTDNLFIKESDNQVIVTDSILIPRIYDKTKVPRKYFYGPAWYFVYDKLTCHIENRFRRKLEKYTISKD